MFKDILVSKSNRGKGYTNEEKEFRGHASSLVLYGSLTV